MRKGFAKTAFICLALIIALGGTGLGYAYWSDALAISGQVETGQLDWELIPCCCTCLCLPCDCPGDRDCSGTLEKSLDDLSNDLDSQKLSELDFNALLKSNLDEDELSQHGCCCQNRCEVEQEDIDWDGDTDKLVVTLKHVRKCCGGLLTFKIHNNGTIPAKITGVNIRPLDFTNGTEVSVWVCSCPDPWGKQIDPWDDPDTWWRDETQAFCLIGIWVKEPPCDTECGTATYQFEVSVDATYWNAP